MLSADFYNASHESTCKPISMMNDFILGAYPCKSYSIDEIDGLDLDNSEKQIAKMVLSNASSGSHKEFLGIDEQRRAFFLNRVQ